MYRLASLLHIFIGSTLAGSAVIAVLVAGHDSLTSILGAAAIGCIAAVPVSLAVARRLYQR